VDFEDFAIKRPEPIKYTVYKKIKNAILFDQLEQGEVLNERKLAGMLTVSRTPVRQALELLLRDGWVAKDGKSVRVNYISYEEYLELLPVRLENEKLAIKLALPLITDKHLREMKKRLNQMGKYAQAIQFRNWESDKRCFLELEKSIHLLFPRISENTHLYSLLENYMDRFLKLGMISLKYRDDSVITHKELTELFDAISNRDLETALWVLEKELYRGKEHAADFLKKRDPETEWFTTSFEEAVSESQEGK